MNREEKLDEIRCLLKKDPSVQRRWVWECRKRILEYLIARYGASASGSDSLEELEPPTVPHLRSEFEASIPPYEVRLILEDIAHLNANSRQETSIGFPTVLKN